MRRPIRRRPLPSEAERKRRAERQRALDAVRPGLYTRRQSARRLGTSVATVVRMEERGVLTKVHLVPNGMVHHRAAQVDALAGGV
jgi:hypothetical protein